MGVINNLIDNLAQRIGASIQGTQPAQAYRDNRSKADSFSVESEISEALANLATMYSAMPISGDSERAKWLDDIADKMFRIKLKPSVVAEFLTGDCIIVPSWNGKNVQNLIIDSDGFEVLGCDGDELTAIAYEVESMTLGGTTYTLMQAVELVPYIAPDGTEALANRYRMYVMAGTGGMIANFNEFSWADRYEQEWYIPNVDRLLIGRLKSHTVNPNDLNAIKGAPICFGASDPISEIHYLLDQMHNEFGLSEKMIMADKRMFQKEWKNGEPILSLPRGKDRLLMATGGMGQDMNVTEWSPDIRYQAYLEALDKQERLVEKAVGVSSGIISTPDDINYQNVDNVRKSQQKTMGFIDVARKTCEQCLIDLVYTWDTLANFYNIVPLGDYEISFDWSNEFIETFADRQNAILAGISVGAMDAVDYRMFVMEESPEAARERVEEIKAEMDDAITIAEV